MRSVKMLGLALALAVVVVSIPARGEEQGGERHRAALDTTKPIEVAVTALELESATVAVKTDSVTNPRYASDPNIAPSSEVLEVAHGRWHSFGDLVSIDLQPAEPNRIGVSTGGRYVSVLSSTGHRIVKDLMCSNFGEKFVFDTGAGDHRACPGSSSGVAPR